MSKILRPGKSSGAKPFSLASFEEASQSIIEAARAEADRILNEAREAARSEAETIRRQAAEEGRKAGYEAGLEEGRRQVIEETKAQFADQAEIVMRTATSLAQELRARVNSLVNEAESAIVELALKIAKKVVKIELERHSANIAGENLRRALELASTGTRLVCAVNPADAEFLEGFMGELAESLALGGAVRIVSDESVSPGGVVVRTEKGLVDGDIDRQLDEIERQLIE